jgi:hypothetical protein
MRNCTFSVFLAAAFSNAADASAKEKFPSTKLSAGRSPEARLAMAG